VEEEKVENTSLESEESEESEEEKKEIVEEEIQVNYNLITNKLLLPFFTIQS